MNDLAPRVLYVQFSPNMLCRRARNFTILEFWQILFTICFAAASVSLDQCYL